jgi:hypothetical protein
MFIPNFKGYDFFPHNMRLPFMRYKGLALGASVVGMVLSVVLFFTLGLNYGVDFKGGSMIEVQSTSGPPGGRTGDPPKNGTVVPGSTEITCGPSSSGGRT